MAKHPDEAARESLRIQEATSLDSPSEFPGRNAYRQDLLSGPSPMTDLASHLGGSYLETPPPDMNATRRRLQMESSSTNSTPSGTIDINSDTLASLNGEESDSSSDEEITPLSSGITELSRTKISSLFKDMNKLSREQKLAQHISPGSSPSKIGDPTLHRVSEISEVKSKPKLALAKESVPRPDGQSKPIPAFGMKARPKPAFGAGTSRPKPSFGSELSRPKPAFGGEIRSKPAFGGESSRPKPGFGGEASFPKPAFGEKTTRPKPAFGESLRPKPVFDGEAHRPKPVLGGEGELPLLQTISTSSPSEQSIPVKSISDKTLPKSSLEQLLPKQLISDHKEASQDSGFNSQSYNCNDLVFNISEDSEEDMQIGISSEKEKIFSALLDSTKVISNDFYEENVLEIESEHSVEEGEERDTISSPISISRKRLGPPNQLKRSRSFQASKTSSSNGTEKRGKKLKMDENEPSPNTDENVPSERKTPSFRRTQSATNIADYLDGKERDPNKLPDHSGSFALSSEEIGKHQVITCHTLAEVLEGRYNSLIKSCRIIDCRYKYEYDGGHINGAESWSHGEEENFLATFLPPELQEPGPGDRNILVFHCEFSTKRGPDYYEKLRGKDRALNWMRYPKLYYPEMYLLKQGYREFWSKYPNLCTGAYTEMNDPTYKQECRKMIGRSNSLASGTVSKVTGQFRRKTGGLGSLRM